MGLRVAVILAFVLLIGAEVRAWPVAFGLPAGVEGRETSYADSRDRIEILAARYRLPREEIASLRRDAMSWVEIDYALFIARRTERPVSQIVALREMGMGKTTAPPRRFGTDRRAGIDAGRLGREEGKSHRGGKRRR